MCFASLGFGQKAYSIFVNNAYLDVYEREMASVVKIQKEIAENEDVKIYAALHRLEKSTEKLSRLGMSMYKKWTAYLSRENLEHLDKTIMGDGISVTHLEYQNQQNRKNKKNHSELLLSQEDVDNFLVNVSAIRDVHEALKFKESVKSVKSGLQDLSPYINNISKILNNTTH